MHHAQRAARRLALVVSIGAALAVGSSSVASAGTAVPQAGGDTPEVVATLKIESANVSVKKKNADNFKAAKEGQKLHAGDTIQTDTTGKAEINYGDNSWTRLDVATTFTIEKLSDDQGNRQVEGSLDTGKAWHRTTALTESQTFEQTGAGATAAVVGTAFGMQCDSPDHCVVYPVVDSVEWTGNNAIHLLAPLETCDSTSAIVCADTTFITPDQLPQWIIDNILLDVLAGYPYPFTVVVTDDGNAFFVPSEGSLPPPPPAPPAPPAFGANAVTITGSGGGGPSTPTGPNTVVSSEDETYTFFTVNATDPQGLPYTLAFTSLPNAAVGMLCAPTSGTVVNVCLGTNAFYTAVAGYEAITNNPSDPYNTTTQFAPDTVFAFAPADFEGSPDPTATSTATVTATDSSGASSSQDVPVEVTEND